MALFFIRSVGNVHNPFVVGGRVSKQKLIGFNLLPETFTMKDVQELYETVYDRPFKINNFQKRILNLNVLERLEKKVTGTASRAPYLYRFRR